MKINLKNKVAIVTGASSGIGLSIAKSLFNLGCRTILLSRDYKKLQKIKENLDPAGKDIEIYQHNVQDLSKYQKIISTIVDKWKTIDILINNAGITRDNLILRMSEEEWDEVLKTNLTGCFNGIKSVSKIMIKQKTGKIINISSVIGIIGNKGQANYAASKAGIIALTKSVAKELGTRNINVNCIAPGYIETDMTKKINNDIVNKMKHNIPLAKLGAGEDIANLVCYLSSDLSSYITGQVINVDGGMTIK